jgi:flagellar biosynthesis/type III secretory pathway protein FliH
MTALRNLAVPVVGPAKGDARVADVPPWANPNTSSPLPLAQVLCSDEGQVGPERDGGNTTAGSVFQDAYNEGVRQAKLAVETIIERYHQAIFDLEMLRDRILVETEHDVVELAIMVAREVLRGDPTACLGFTEDMVEHALKILREADSITLRVSATDRRALMSKHPELMSDRAVVQVVADPSITLGGVIAECGFGRVDASLERRLADAARALRDDKGAASSPAESCAPENS